MSNPPTIWSAGFKTITVLETDAHVAAEIRVTCGNPDFTRRISRLTAEAGAIYEQTGLTPRQQRDELLAALNQLVSAVIAGQRPGTYINQIERDALKVARAAIAKAEGRT